MLFWRMAFDSFFKKKLTDEFFGEIEFKRISMPRGYPTLKYWEAKKLFKPLNAVINITVYSDRKGINPHHKLLFKKIEEQYLILNDKAKQLSETQEYKEYFEEDGYGDFNFENDLRLDGLNLDNNFEGGYSFDLVYELKNNTKIKLTASFENFEIIDIEIFDPVN